MLHRITLLLVALFALFVGTTSTLQAQCAGNTCSATFHASVVIQPIMSCTTLKDNLDFGTHLKSEGKASLSELTSGRVRCVIDPANGVVDITFVLPSVLTRVGGTQTLPITFGNESLRLYDCDGNCAVPQGVNPAVAQSKTITSGFLTLALGENGPNDPAGEVSVNLSSAQSAGTYRGDITLQIALR